MLQNYYGEENLQLIFILNSALPIATIILNLNMPRTNREETKEKKVPFKKWAVPNCSNRWEFYDSVKKISFCRNCKLNYYCSNEALKIKAVLKIVLCYCTYYIKLVLI